LYVYKHMHTHAYTHMHTWYTHTIHAHTRTTCTHNTHTICSRNMLTQYTHTHTHTHNTCKHTHTCTIHTSTRSGTSNMWVMWVMLLSTNQCKVANVYLLHQRVERWQLSTLALEISVRNFSIVGVSTYYTLTSLRRGVCCSAMIRAAARVGISVCNIWHGSGNWYRYWINVTTPIPILCTFCTLVFVLAHVTAWIIALYTLYIFKWKHLWC